VERSRRVFMPEAMFTSGKKGNRRVVVAGGFAGLGIGLTQRADMTETTFFDVIDLHQQFLDFIGKNVHRDDDELVPPSALGVISVGAGVFTMVGGQLVGARGLIEAVLRVGEVLSNENTRKWIAPIIGASVLGLTVYVVLELPNSIPRTVGRRVRRSVLSDGEWVEGHATRVGRETRKVLKLAGWDLRERFRAALDERGKEVGRSEEMERKAARAKDWFEHVLARTGHVRLDAGLVVA